MKNKSKNILITGVSTGIGYEMAKLFLDRGFRVFGSVRKEEDGERISQELGDYFSPLLFDVTDHEAIEAAASDLTARIGEEGLGGLINNAGIAVGGPLIDLSVDEYRRQFEVNVFGLIKVTQAFLPLLGARDQHKMAPGKIIQISSIAGKQGMPFMSAYSGSKHALEGITESLRKELLLYGIDVVLIEPGPIKTPIWEKGVAVLAEEKFRNSAYAHSMEKFLNDFVNPTVAKAWTAEAVARKVVKVFEMRRPKTRYLIVAQKFRNWTLPRLLPDRLIDKFLGKALGLLKRS